MVTRFDGATAASVSGETFAPRSDAGNYPPRVFFDVDSERLGMLATPPMARIECSLLIAGDASDVRLMDVRGDDAECVAHVTVHAIPGGSDITTETIAIASAIYWSWWRALDMRGEVVRDAR